MGSFNTGLCLLTIMVLGTAAPAQAGVYKWMDESGQVHYSETPPPQLKPDQVKRIEVKTDTPEQPPTVSPVSASSEAPLKCGSITLPQNIPSPVARLAQLKQARAIWQKYLEENSGSSDAEILQRVDDRRCAIEYANRELQALSEVEADVERNYQLVSDELEDLEARVRECEESQPEEGEPTVAECRRQYERRISELKKMQRSLQLTPQPSE